RDTPPTPPNERGASWAWRSDEQRQEDEKKAGVDFAKIQKEMAAAWVMNQAEDKLPGARLSYRYRGYEFVKGELWGTTLQRGGDGQKSAPAATSWELKRSILAANLAVGILSDPRVPVSARGPGPWFSPVVVPSGFEGLARVVGHVGLVKGW